MKLSVGELVSVRESAKKTKNEKIILVIKSENKDECLGLLVDVKTRRIISNGLNQKKNSSEWRVDLMQDNCESGNAPRSASVLVHHPLFFSKKKSKPFGKVNRDYLDKVLRAFNKFSAKIYYDHASSKPPSQNIPVSGKVLDEHDLYNMIDASLDMWLTTGRFNAEFEKKLKSFLGTNYVITVNSGSSANLLALTTLTSPKLGKRQLKEGDEVITVAAGFPTTINPIIQNGLVPVFVDIELGTYDIDVSQIESTITEKTKAIMIAHALGNPFNISAVKSLTDKYSLWLIEDNCDALGSKYAGKYTGTFGHIATLSFYPAHHITMGEGGAVIINDKQLYKIAQSFRDWGRDCWCETGKDNTCGKRFEWQLGNLPDGYDHKYIYSHIGYNLKITDWQAAIGLSQLEKLPIFIEKRKENFERLYKGLQAYNKFLILPKATENSEPSWFGFLVTVKENSGIKKNDLVRYLEQNKIGTRQMFSGNILRQPAYLDKPCKLRIRNSELLLSTQLKEEHYKMLPNTAIVMNNTFWVGVAPMLNSQMIDIILFHFKKFFQQQGSIKINF